MTCVSIIKWFVLVLVMVSKNQSNKTKNGFLLPRFELGMVDSKSTVITTSLQEKHKNGTLSFKRTLARHRQDSNLRGRSPVDFESTSLTTRTRHNVTQARQPFGNRTQCRDRTDDHTIKSRALCQTELIRQTEWSLADARLNTTKHTSYKQPYHDSKQHPCPLFQNFSFSPIHS
jgi:hypothetical protein